jgi:cobalt-zinc-cadmium efflux system outer membrane protein
MKNVGSTTPLPVVRACRLVARNGFIVVMLLAQSLSAQTILTWQQLKDKFEATNPTLKAAQLNIDESRAEEITAYLRPNPDMTAGLDQMNPFSTQPPPSGGPNVYRPFAYAFPYGSVTYLHERRHKRELRLESAKDSTDVAVSA